MTGQRDATQRLAGQVRQALEAADLAACADLLDPAVRLGPPGDPSPPCQNRDQVLAWYQRGRDAGTRARVTGTLVSGNRILVGLKVTGWPMVALLLVAVSLELSDFAASVGIGVNGITRKPGCALG